MASIVYDKTFIKNVEDFVFKNEKKYSKYIESKKAQIPPIFRKGGTLYRGMILQDFGEMTLGDISSWTPDVKMATRFATDASKRMHDTPGKAYVFKKNIPDTKVILNIASLLNFLNNSFMLDDFGFDEGTLQDGLEEQEVLVDKGIKLTKSNVFKIY